MNAKVYFKNLNGFRFIAAMMVIVCHLELFKFKIGIENAWLYPLIFESGSAGVDFFFVLSGFLITVLLLVEKEKTGTISLKKFYARRILRILPLYYLVFLFTFLVVPKLSIFFIEGYSEQINEHFWNKFLLYFFLLPNGALSFYGEIPYSAPLWSIGVEEQFYLFWPIIIISFARLLKPIIIFIAFFIALKILTYAIGKVNMLGASEFEQVKNFIVATRLECMGIGGIGAYLYYKNNLIMTWLSSNAAAILAIIALPCILWFAAYLQELHHIFLSVLFLIIIMNGATNSGTFINLENKVFYFLGSISFGLYVWHPLCIGVSLWMMNRYLLWDRPTTSNLIYYSASIGLTIGLSFLSYHYFERFFLQFKNKFTIVSSGDEAKDETKKLVRTSYID